MSLSCDAFSSEALICWRTGNACTVGFSIKNSLAGDSMQRSLHQTLSELPTAMADEGGQRLTASRKKRRNPQIRTNVSFPAAYPLKLTHRRSAIHQVLRAPES